jgi:hypothetical protein
MVKCAALGVEPNVVFRQDSSYGDVEWVRWTGPAGQVLPGHCPGESTEPGGKDGAWTRDGAISNRADTHVHCNDVMICADVNSAASSVGDQSQWLSIRQGVSLSQGR